MKKIEKYVVFKYEDEFGFHYMVMDELPGEGPISLETLSFKKKINPNCTPGAITRQQFSEDGKTAYVPSSKFVPVSGWWTDKGDVMEWQEKTRAYRATKAPKRQERALAYRVIKALEGNGEELKLEKAIEPTRETSNRLNPSRRSIFIAQVVYLPTK